MAARVLHVRKPMAPTGSTVSRADAKSEAASAAKSADKVMGEISQQAQDKGKTRP